MIGEKHDQRNRKRLGESKQRETELNNKVHRQRGGIFAQSQTKARIDPYRIHRDSP